MRVLVTGGDGLLGTALRKIADGVACEYIFTGYDDFDITDQEAVDLMLKVNGFDVVINCAAVTDPVKIEKHEDVAYNVNVAGAGNLAMASAREGTLLIQPVCNASYLKECKVESLSGQRTVETIVQSGCDAVIIETAPLTLDQWRECLDKVAEHISKIVGMVNPDGWQHGVQYVKS